METSCDELDAMISTNPFHNDLYIPLVISCFCFATLCFVTSSITGNYSQVDKLWSITPVVYAWICAVDTRTYVMATLVTVWGIRLSFNFYRRGGYPSNILKFWDGEEDYRWAVLQRGDVMPGKLFKLLKYKVVWVVFNVIFISLYQHLLLLWIVSPSLVAAAYGVSSGCDSSNEVLYSDKLNVLDVVASVGMICFILLEGIADNQQFSFQQEKYRRRNSGEELGKLYEAGFCRNGLFAIVRKPNYASEQMIWITYYLFSVAATNGRNIFNWSSIGFVMLLLLFQGSGWMTELITVQKYPKYADYQQNTPLYLPNFFCLLATKKKLS